jgi:hypothetical protein
MVGAPLRIETVASLYAVDRPSFCLQAMRRSDDILEILACKMADIE